MTRRKRSVGRNRVSLTRQSRVSCKRPMTRLRPLTSEESHQVGAASKVVGLRMNLEPKRDGERKCRLILQGFREPKSWDRGTIDSPVASLSTIRAIVFMMGRLDDILSSIDVSTAFLQSQSYDSVRKSYDSVSVQPNPLGHHTQHLLGYESTHLITT